MKIESYISSRDVHKLKSVSRKGIRDIISISDIYDFRKWPDFSDFITPITIHRFAIDDTNEHTINFPDRPGQKLPTKEDVDKLLDTFYDIMDRREDIKILFHCNAGYNRSTAASFIFYVAANYSFEDAYRISKESSLQQERFTPNLLIVKLADKILNFNGDMIKFAVEKSPHKDYLDRFGY